MLLTILLVLLVLWVSSGSRGYSRYGPIAIAPACFVLLLLGIYCVNRFVFAR